MNADDGGATYSAFPIGKDAMPNGERDEHNNGGFD